MARNRHAQAVAAASASSTKCPRPLPCNACRHSRKKCDLKSPCAGCCKKGIECCYNVGPTRYNRKKTRRSLSSSGTTDSVSSSSLPPTKADEFVKNAETSPFCMEKIESDQFPASPTTSGFSESVMASCFSSSDGPVSPLVLPLAVETTATNDGTAKSHQIAADRLLQTIQSDLATGYDSLTSLLESQTRPILYQQLDLLGYSLVSALSKSTTGVISAGSSKALSNLLLDSLLSDIHGHSSLHGTYNASICMINSPFLILTAQQPLPNGSMCAIFSGVFEAVNSAFSILDLASRLLEVTEGDVSLLDSTPLVLPLAEAATVFWFLLCRTLHRWWSLFQNHKIFDRCRMKEGLHMISKLLASLNSVHFIDDSLQPIVARVAAMVCEAESVVVSS